MKKTKRTIHREKHKLSIEEVAVLAKCTGQTIRNFESGAKNSLLLHHIYASNFDFKLKRFEG
jgi:transcriptional regulator with XRE-family HTH domain